MSGGGQDTRCGEDQSLTGQDVVAVERPHGVAPFTPEQVAATRGYADASRTASTQAK